MPNGKYVVEVVNGQAVGTPVPYEGVANGTDSMLGGWGSLVIWGVIIVGAIMAAFGSFFTVSQQTFRVVERLGKFRKIATAGLNVKIPFIDRVSREVSLKINEISESVDAKSKDNAFITVPVKVQYQIIAEKAQAAYYTLGDAKAQIQSYIVNTVRSSAAAMTMQDVFESKNTIEQDVLTALNEKFTSYGFQIVNVLVDNPLPSEAVRKSFDAVISSQRLKEAATNEAEAARIKTVGIAKADAEALVLKATAYKEQREIMLTAFEGISPELRDTLIGIDYRDMVRESAARGSTVLFVPSEQAGSDIAKTMAALKSV